VSRAAIHLGCSITCAGRLASSRKSLALGKADCWSGIAESPWPLQDFPGPTGMRWILARAPSERENLCPTHRWGGCESAPMPARTAPRLCDQAEHAEVDHACGLRRQLQRRPPGRRETGPSAWPSAPPAPSGGGALPHTPPRQAPSWRFCGGGGRAFQRRARSGPILPPGLHSARGFSRWRLGPAEGVSRLTERYEGCPAQHVGAPRAVRMVGVSEIVRPPNCPIFSHRGAAFSRAMNRLLASLLARTVPLTVADHDHRPRPRGIGGSVGGSGVRPRPAAPCVTA
jgi:hypothetical protein